MRNIETSKFIEKDLWSYSILIDDLTTEIIKLVVMRLPQDECTVGMIRAVLLQAANEKLPQCTISDLYKCIAEKE